jgi:hypothetical protein
MFAAFAADQQNVAVYNNDNEQPKLATTSALGASPRTAASQSSSTNSTPSASTTMRSIYHLAEKRDNRKGLARGTMVFFLESAAAFRYNICLKWLITVEHMRLAS